MVSVEIYRVQPLHWEKSFYLARKVTVEVRGKVLTRYECFSRTTADGQQVRQLDTLAESEAKNIVQIN